MFGGLIFHGGNVPGDGFHPGPPVFQGGSVPGTVVGGLTVGVTGVEGNREGELVGRIGVEGVTGTVGKGRILPLCFGSGFLGCGG